MEKKVSYSELVFDLIFVYMVGRDNALLHVIRNGFVEPIAFLAYVVSALSIIQIWNYVTFYINMFGNDGRRDHLFIWSNMFLLYFIGAATKSHYEAYIGEYHIAWGLILLNVALQYFLEMRNHSLDLWNRDVMIRMAVTLLIEAAMVFTASFLAPLAGTILSLIAIMTGVVLTSISRRKSIGGQVDFMHLSERAMLYVVFTFGEMVISVASYFSGNGRFHLVGFSFALIIFLIIIGISLSYEIVYEHLLNRGGPYTGLSFMFFHIFILFAMNFITVSLEFMLEDEINVFGKTLLLSVSVVMYFLFLILLNGHFKKRCRFGKPFVIKFSLISVVYVLLALASRHMPFISAGLTLAYVFYLVVRLFMLERQMTN